MISGPMVDRLLREMYESQRFVIAINRLTSWYYHKLKLEPSIIGVIWTPDIRMAHYFHDEKSVEEFKSKYISPRIAHIHRLKD